MKVIETKRVYLRMFTIKDLDALALICNNPQVMKYIGVNCKPVPREEVEEALTSILAHWDKHGFGRWAVIDKESNKLIGYAGLRAHEGTAELVYLLDEPFWNKGIATEMSQAIIKTGFEINNFPRIIAMTRPENVASIRVMEKIGMKLEKGDVIYGISAIIYAILKEDYHSKISASISQN